MIKKIFKTSNWLQKKPFIYLLLFLVVFSYFLWLNSVPVFSDPDSFYHAKITQLIAEQGIVKNFDSLPFTTLNEIYIDHHLLYHLILAPFIFLFDPLIVVKLGAVFFATLAVVFFYWFLNKFKIKYVWLYTLLLLTAHQFIYRINLAKIPALSLIFLLLFLYFLFKPSLLRSCRDEAVPRPYKGNPRNDTKIWSWPLFSISFFYVWLYGGWIIMFGIGIIYWLAKTILDKIKNYKNNYKLFFNIVSGFILGLIVNPYFPTNLKFYWQQTFKIGLINYKNVISVGGEWYGPNLIELIGYNVLVFIILFLAICVFIYNLKKQNAKNWTLFLVTLIFFVLTLKSRRNIEYFIPFALIFSGFVLNRFFNFAETWRRHLSTQFVIPKIFILLSIIQIPIIFSFNYFGLKSSLRKGYRFDQLSGVSNWLKYNTKKGEIIFHDNWSDWPSLFYYNSNNRYIIGLDPSFMYFKDQNKYWTWNNISTGQIKKNICDKINNEFRADYVFVREKNNILRKIIELDKKCRLVYKDGDGSIYKIKSHIIQKE